MRISPLVCGKEDHPGASTIVRLNPGRKRASVSLTPSPSVSRRGGTIFSYVQCDGRRSRLSVEGDDNLAVGAALLDVGQRLEGLVKWKRLVDDWAELAGVVEGGQLAKLGAVGLHEQERVAHSELPGLLVDLSAQQPHHDAHELRRRELFRETGVRRAGDADRLSAGLEDCEGLLEVLAAERVQHDVVAGED